MIIILLPIVPVSWLDNFSWLSLMPFFIIGLMIKKYYNYFFLHSTKIFIVCALMFSIFVSIWAHHTFDIYSNPIEWTIPSWIAYVKRVIIGSAGSIMVISASLSLFADKQSSNRYLQNVGTMTLGIYIIQRYLVERSAIHLGKYVDKILSPLPKVLHTIVYDILLTPAFSILVIAFSYYVILQLRKNRYTKLLFLGEKNNL